MFRFMWRYRQARLKGDAVEATETAKKRSTHFMVSEAMSDKLRLLSRLTRIRQAVYIREALRDGLAKYDAGGAAPEGMEPVTGRLLSVVPRVPVDGLEKLKALAHRTRIRESEWWRIFVADMLGKYSAQLERALEAA